jgi:hypothetical protein
MDWACFRPGYWEKCLNLRRSEQQFHEEIHNLYSLKIIVLDLCTNEDGLASTGAWEINKNCVLKTRHLRRYLRIILKWSRVKNFLFSVSSRPALGGTQPTIQWVTGGTFSGVKWPKRETDHSPPPNAEVKKTCIYISTSTYAFMA